MLSLLLPSTGKVIAHVWLYFSHHHRRRRRSLLLEYDDPLMTYFFPLLFSSLRFLL